jgi:hypothetical protein
MPAGALYHTAIGPSGMIPPALGATAATNMILNATTERIGWKFYASNITSITHVDVRLIVLGDVTGMTFTLDVETDSSDAPSGSLVGAATAAFAGPASTGFLGEQELLTPTGALTPNTPYWIVLKRASGTPDGSYSLQASYATTGPLNREKMRHFDGTNWTNTAVANQSGLAIRKGADGSYQGYPVTSTLTNSGQADIYTNGGTIQRQGISFEVGATATVRGVYTRFTKTGTPGDLVCKVYEGAVEKASETIDDAEVTNNSHFMIWFTTAPTVSAGATCYITFQQAGTSDANDYDMSVHTVQAAYISAIGGVSHRYIYGTGVDPTAHTPLDTHFPLCIPLLGDPAADLTGDAPATTSIFMVLD